jgi:hypothetical protein
MYRVRYRCLVISSKFCDLSLLHWPLFRAVPYRDVGGGGQCGKKNVLCSLPFKAQKKSRFKRPPFPVALVMDIARIKIITFRAILLLLVYIQ